MIRLTFMDGTQIQEVVNALDIRRFMLSRWRKEYREVKYMADRRIKKWWTMKRSRRPSD